jgi:hypothetical protein
LRTGTRREILIVQWSKSFTGAICVVALLLPSMVAAESHLQTKAAGTASVATARVNFKIVIPTVLYMQVGNAADRALGAARPLGAETVAIMSNSRNVTLNATLRRPDSDVALPGNVVRSAPAILSASVLSASGRKVIAQDAPCTAGDALAHPVVCTVSMP